MQRFSIQDGHRGVQECMKNNVPCIVENVHQFFQCQDWVLEDDQIHWSYLVERYGHLMVPVVALDLKNNESRREVPFAKFAQDMKDGQCVYLKDWHLYQKDRGFYSTPSMFQEDWLNHYCDANGLDDYRFVYMGAAGTWTALHHDVIRSYSWSVNICGRKRWIMFPEDAKLGDANGDLPTTILDSNGNVAIDIPHIDIEQGPYEAIFVPSGWHHEVHNLQDTISINHNWLNQYNVHSIIQYLHDQLDLVKAEIHHLRASFADEPGSFEKQCQVLLKANIGIHFSEFQKLLDDQKAFDLQPLLEIGELSLF